MFHRLSTRRRGRLALAAALALALAGLASAALRGQDAAGGAQVSAEPIAVAADEIATWTDGPRRAFLLRGNAVVTQGAVAARMPQGVVWVDEEAKARTGNYQIELYGEEGLRLQRGGESQTAGAGIIRLSTRGDVRIRPSRGTVAQQARPDDVVYRRASEALARSNTPAPLPANVLANASSVPRPPAGDVRLAQAEAPAPATPALPVPSVAPPADVVIPATPPPDNNPPRELIIRPRSSVETDLRSFRLDNDETAVVYTGGVILMVRSPGGDKGLLDIEGDRLVVWTKGSPQDLLGKAKSQNVTGKALEFYLAGNVQLRMHSDKEATVLRADEVYYDVGRSVAIAVQADLEVKDPKLPHALHLQSPELWQLNAKTFQANTAEVFSTVLPSDPGLKVQLNKAVIEERQVIRRNIFGLPYRDPVTLQPKAEKELYFTGNNFLARLEGVPVFYFPYFAGRVDDPLGPLDSISFSFNRVFGAQVYSTWDVFDLLGLYRPKGQRWRLFLDYLSDRGPAAGTQFDLREGDFFGTPAYVEGQVKAWGLRDRGTDILGGSRSERAFINQDVFEKVTHPELRGRFLSKLNVQELPQGFSFQGQLALLSDRNFLEQFYLNEFHSGYNQETFAYVKQQQDNWAWTALGEVRLRDWVTETEWLPKLDGWLIGESLFDRLTYNAHAGAGYARLRPTDVPPFPAQVTDRRVDTGRFDLWQDVSLPFYAGPVRVVPYAVGDLTWYSEDLAGDSRGRAYGGGGLRTSLPFSRLYPEVESDLFNVNGIFHKAELTGNYFLAGSSVGYRELPQLDRLNDDVTDLTLRQMRIYQFFLNKSNAAFLTTSPLFDPQFFAVRRLLDNRTDTLDDIHVWQMGLRQRWQTKRGFPGNQHVIDWMTLDLRATLFPAADRDNFGRSFGVLEYDWLWNIGDRTALTSSAWAEPVPRGPRVFNLGAHFNRPDYTSFFLGYRQIEPLNSKMVIGSVTYAFSPKYALTASTTWDFGVDNQNYTLMLTRLGTDLQVSLGVSYNSILNNLGVNFEVVPSLLRRSVGTPGTQLIGPGQTTATGNAR